MTKVEDEKEKWEEKETRVKIENVQIVNDCQIFFFTLQKYITTHSEWEKTQSNYTFRILQQFRISKQSNPNPNPKP